MKYSIEPGETYNPVPSEFYQIEANVTEINNHPPYPSDDGYWMIYNVNTHEYEKSEIPVIAKPGDGLPDIDITTDGKYLSNDGTKAIWADVEVEAKDAVLYTRQDLTDAQKQQARDNIGAGTSSFSGSYNDLTNKPDAYELPIASSSQLGGVKPDNKIDDMTQAVGVDNEGKLWSEPDIFIVNIRNAVSDKSSAEIFLAISNGKVVYANDGGRIYPSIGGQGTILQQFAIVDDTGYISGYSIRGTVVTQLKNWVEVKSNKVNTISATSSDNQYPSAKCVYDELEKKQGKPEIYEATFSPGDWSMNGSGYYEQSLTIEGLKRDYILPPDIDIKLSGTDASLDAQLLADWALVSLAQVDNDTLVLLCVGDPPANLDMPVIVRVWQ